ncbi:hypothetical protein BCR33DRAFT_711264, partial [Rhizoclosmatium globosum]
IWIERVDRTVEQLLIAYFKSQNKHTQATLGEKLGEHRNTGSRLQSPDDPFATPNISTVHLDQRL